MAPSSVYSITTFSESVSINGCLISYAGFVSFSITHKGVWPSLFDSEALAVVPGITVPKTSAVNNENLKTFMYNVKKGKVYQE